MGEGGAGHLDDVQLKVFDHEAAHGKALQPAWVLPVRCIEKVHHIPDKNDGRRVHVQYREAAGTNTCLVILHSSYSRAGNWTALMNEILASRPRLAALPGYSLAWHMPCCNV